MTTYKIEGMTCGGCARSVTNALEQALPEAKIEVTLEGGLVEIEGEHTPDQAREAVEDAGFDWLGAA